MGFGHDEVEIRKDEKCLSIFLCLMFCLINILVFRDCDNAYFCKLLIIASRLLNCGRHSYALWSSIVKLKLIR